MNPEQWKLVRSAFEALIDLPAATRAERLAELAQTAPEIAAEVAGLLAADGDAGTQRLAPLAVDVAVAAVAHAETDRHLGTCVGPWQILAPLGEGGMGTVYLAERAGPGFRQRAALKLLRVGQHSSAALRRFSAEQRMLAALQHPNIAHLIDGGISADGSPYLALEYVAGSSLTRYAATAGLGPRERVSLFLEVCMAVEHAHQRLIVHRDLKPGNILVDADGQVKLLDFGIGKLLGELDEDQRLTSTGVRLFTLGYGAPEQLRGEPVSTATDVYSLGVVLYELLTGHLPFAVTSQSAVDWERVVLTEEPTPPSRRGPELAGATQQSPRSMGRLNLPAGWAADLDAIVLKALRKEPERRYTSVSALRADLQALLHGRPVSAQRGSRRYRAQKFVRRHALALGLGSAALLALLVGSVIALWQADVARNERDRASAERLQAQQEARRAETTVKFLVDVFANADPGHADGAEPTARDLLAAGEAELKQSTDLDAATRTSLTIAMARAHMGLGDSEAMLRLMQEVQPAATASGSARLQIDALLNLGIAYNRSAQRAEALARYAQAEAIYRAQSLDDPLLMANIDRLMATDLSNLDRDEEALVHVQRAYQVLLREAGPLSQSLIDCLDVYLILLYDQGRGDQAVGITQPSFDALANASNLPTQRRAQILASHAYALKLAGRAVEAEAPIRASLALEESLYGSDSEALTSGLSKLVSILRDQRRYADAAAVADRAVAIRRATLPPRHPALLFGIQNAARVWLQAGDLARARALIDEALAGYQANGSSDTSAGVSARLIHVEALLKEGNLDDARAVLAAVEPLTSVMGATDKALSERLRAKLMGSNEPRSGR